MTPGSGFSAGWTGCCTAITGTGCGRGRRRAVRNAALRRCAEWIIARQERDGCWGGIQPPWVYSLIALHLLGYGLDHPVIRRGLDGLDGFTIWEQTPDGPVRRLEACQSPVWDTVLAMVALADAGLPPDHPALVQAGGWVLDEEIRGPGDWQVRRPGLAPGGWAFEFDNDIYPDVDDTAEVLLALRQAALGPGGEQARQRGIAWLAGMQSKDGGWGAFDADNTRRLVTRLPFCDFGEVIDPPSADVTAHTIEALAAEGLAGSRAVRRGVAWLLRAQESDGSWFGRWGANYVYGTGAAVPALIAAGVRPGKPVIRRAVSWLAGCQNDRRRLGRGPALLRRPELGGPGHLDRLPDRVGAAGAARGRGSGGGRADRARHRLPGRDPAPGRHLGRAAVHRDRLPRRLLPQLPPVPPGVPGQRARPVPQPGGGRGSAMTDGTSMADAREPETDSGLLVCAPLRTEARAVRRGLAVASYPGAPQQGRAAVRRTGYGAARSAARG